MAHLGWSKHNQAIGCEPDTPRIMGHIWGRDCKPAFAYAQDWYQALARRVAYMPVRDPAQLAFSWQHVHGQGLDFLRASLREACRLIDMADITLIDTRQIAPANVKGTGQRDQATGRALLADYPQYFGEFYNGR